MIIHHQILGHHGCHLVLEAYELLRHLQDHEYLQLLPRNFLRELYEFLWMTELRPTDKERIYSSYATRFQWVAGPFGHRRTVPFGARGITCYMPIADALGKE